MRRTPAGQGANEPPKIRQRSPEFPAFSDLFRPFPTFSGFFQVFPGFSNHSATARERFSLPRRDSAAIVPRHCGKGHARRMPGRCQVGATGRRRGIAGAWTVMGRRVAARAVQSACKACAGPVPGRGHWQGGADGRRMDGQRRRNSYGLTFNPAFTARAFWRASKVRKFLVPSATAAASNTSKPRVPSVFECAALSASASE
jgi:hypothetical protein